MMLYLQFCTYSLKSLTFAFSPLLGITVSESPALLLLVFFCFQDIPGILPFEKYSRDHFSDSINYVIFKWPQLIREITLLLSCLLQRIVTISTSKAAAGGVKILLPSSPFHHLWFRGQVTKLPKTAQIHPLHCVTPRWIPYVFSYSPWRAYPYNPSLHSSRMIFPGHRSGNDRLLLKCPPCPQVSVLRMCTRVRCPAPPRLPSLLPYHSPLLTILEPHLPSPCFSKHMCSSHVCTCCPLHLKHSPTRFLTWLAPSYPSLHSEFFADHKFKVICWSVLAIFQHFKKNVC